MKKRAVERPYRPVYCSAETLAYLLDVSRSTLDDWVRLGHLPPPVEVGTQRRWRWDTVDQWISARAGVDEPHDAGIGSEEADPFAAGVNRARGTAANA